MEEELSSQSKEIPTNNQSQETYTNLENDNFSEGDILASDNQDLELDKDVDEIEDENILDAVESRIISFKAVLNSSNLVDMSSDLSLAVTSVSDIHIIVSLVLPKEFNFFNFYFQIKPLEKLFF